MHCSNLFVFKNLQAGFFDSLLNTLLHTGPVCFTPTQRCGHSELQCARQIPKFVHVNLFSISSTSIVNTGMIIISRAT